MGVYQLTQLLLAAGKRSSTICLLLGHSADFTGHCFPNLAPLSIYGTLTERLICIQLGGYCDAACEMPG